MEVGAHHARGHARQVAAAQRRRGPLHDAQVGGAGGAQPAVAPRLQPHPLLGVVAVLSFAERVELAVRIPPPAAVLNHARVTGGRQPPPLFDQRVVVVAVGGTDQHGRHRRRAARPIDVRRQEHTVAHRHLHVQLHGDVVRSHHRASLAARGGTRRGAAECSPELRHGLRQAGLIVTPRPQGHHGPCPRLPAVPRVPCGPPAARAPALRSHGLDHARSPRTRAAPAASARQASRRSDCRHMALITPGVHELARHPPPRSDCVTWLDRRPESTNSRSAPAASAAFGLPSHGLDHARSGTRAGFSPRQLEAFGLPSHGLDHARSPRTRAAPAASARGVRIAVTWP